MPLFRETTYITEFMVKHWTKEGYYVVFGDNKERWGKGGMQKICRNVPNCIGIVTKHNPTLRETAFFTDKINELEWVQEDLAKIENLLKEGKTVIVPYKENKWTVGESNHETLEFNSPKIFNYIQWELNRLEQQYA